jgi:tRNA (mo5U34)-methyltransferase
LQANISLPADPLASSQENGLPLHGFEGQRNQIPGVDGLTDEDLERLNQLLPWSAFLLDAQGRRFGDQYSAKKRSRAETIPSKRIANFIERFGVNGKVVLEIGCFEGIHSAAFALEGARVTAVDSRIENVCKTLVRCGLMHLPVSAHVWNVEEPAPSTLDLNCDLLCHIGVLYHLADPVSHLNSLLPHVKQAVIIETHVAPEDGALLQYEVNGQIYDYHHFDEGNRANPFAGMYDHAKWLKTETLKDILTMHGFKSDLVEHREERNGPRVLIHGYRIES